MRMNWTLRIVCEPLAYRRIICRARHVSSVRVSKRRIQNNQKNVRLFRIKWISKKERKKKEYRSIGPSSSSSSSSLKTIFLCTQQPHTNGLSGYFHFFEGLSKGSLGDDRKIYLWNTFPFLSLFCIHGRIESHPSHSVGNKPTPTNSASSNSDPSLFCRKVYRSIHVVLIYSWGSCCSCCFFWIKD